MFINSEHTKIVNNIGNEVKRIEKEILTYALKKLEDNIPKDTIIEKKKLDKNQTFSGASIGILLLQNQRIKDNL